MLSRSERLTREEFKEFFQKGRRFHSPSLTVVFVPNERFRASAVISKKIAKTAVARNKFRRRVYSVFEQCVEEGLREGVFICIAKERAPSLPFEELRTELRGLVHKTGVLG